MPKTYKELMEKQNNLTGFNCIDWYLCFNTNIPGDILNSNNSLDNRNNDFISKQNTNFINKYIDKNIDF